LSCDIRIAARDAKFGFPETGVGLTITSAGTKLISQTVGLGKAKELVFTGEIIDAQQALEIGHLLLVEGEVRVAGARAAAFLRAGAFAPVRVTASPAAASVSRRVPCFT